jgi:hypothetical protein
MSALTEIDERYDPLGALHDIDGRAVGLAKSPSRYLFAVFIRWAELRRIALTLDDGLRK